MSNLILFCCTNTLKYILQSVRVLRSGIVCRLVFEIVLECLIYFFVISVPMTRYLLTQVRCQSRYFGTEIRMVGDSIYSPQTVASCCAAPVCEALRQAKITMAHRDNARASGSEAFLRLQHIRAWLHRAAFFW